jgi:hypothetical protein
VTDLSQSGAMLGARKDGLAAAAKGVADHASALARLEIELALAELKKKATALGLGLGLGVAAAVLGLLAVPFAFAAIAAGLATFLPVWLALLIVAGALLGVAVLLGALAAGRLKKGTPLVPEQAIHEAKLTGETLRGR